MILQRHQDYLYSDKQSRGEVDDTEWMQRLPMRPEVNDDLGASILTPRDSTIRSAGSTSKAALNTLAL